MPNDLALSWSEWAAHDALGLAALVRYKQVTARELALQAAAGIARLNPALNAVLEVWSDRVEGLDERTLGDGPFRGVPFVWKDIGLGEGGRLQEQGSRLMRGHLLPADHFAAAKLKRAGVNGIARATCPEFGFTLVTESTLAGATRNPWSLAHTPGGSSGGSAAVVAAGIVPMAHSDDGGGSTRIPAAFCGNVGLKTSRGVVSLHPESDHLLASFVSELVNTRSVRDTAAALDALWGPAPGEPFPFAKPERPFLAEVGAPTGRLRIAVAADGLGAYAPTPELSAETRRVARLLESMGHAVEEAAPAFDAEAYLRAWIAIWVSGADVLVDAIEAATGRKATPENLEPIVWLAVERARRMTRREHHDALVVQAQTSRALGAFFEGWDVLLTPTVARPTPEVGSDVNLMQRGVSLDAWFEPFKRIIPYTPLANFTGVPAISLPLAQLGSGADALPLGMHFMAPMGEDARLIRLAAALEQAAPWSARRPPLHVAR
jgi:amidase